MAEQEGSKAMTVYIVVCFALAMAALVGYKVMNDKRSSLADDYRRSSNQFADISLGYARNINNFYFGQSQGQYQRNDLATMEATPHEFRLIAERQRPRIPEGRDGHTITIRPEEKGRGANRYTESRCRVVLDNVTQQQWMGFLRDAVRHSAQYATVDNISVNRKDSNFNNISGPNAGTPIWRVTIEFVWFTPAGAQAASR